MHNWLLVTSLPSISETLPCELIATTFCNYFKISANINIMDTYASNSKKYDVRFGQRREERVANCVGRSHKTKKSGHSNSDVRKLQKQFFDLSKENELLKELLDRIERGAIQKSSSNKCSDGDAKIEEMLKDLKLEKQQQQRDAPQIAPLSDCDDDASNEYLPRNIDISNRSGDDLDLCNPNLMDSGITEQHKQPDRKPKKYNYCTADGEGPIDYFQLYS